MPASSRHRTKAPRLQDAPGTGRTASNAFRLDSPNKAQQRKDREEVRFSAAALSLALSLAATPS